MSRRKTAPIFNDKNGLRWNNCYFNWNIFYQNKKKNGAENTKKLQIFDFVKSKILIDYIKDLRGRIKLENFNDC